MSAAERIHIVGAGAVGLALAACLTEAGKRVTLVRAFRERQPGDLLVSLRREPEEPLCVPVESVSLSGLRALPGLVVVTAKSYVNAALAEALAERRISGPLVILQNGLDVEAPFLSRLSVPVYRGVLYMTGHLLSEQEVCFRAVGSSPIGPVRQSGEGNEAVVDALSTPGLPFRAEPHIQAEAWRKTIINSVFNTICPLLEVDNGIFARSEPALALAREVIAECVALAARQGFSFTEAALLENVLKISRGSSGVFISTLQDIRHGRPTEIDSLNLALARIAAAQSPPLSLAKTKLLGRLTLLKSPAGGLHD